MSEEIKEVKLGFTCSENWDAMTAALGGRHCNTCNKTVYDLTNSKANEFRRLMAENNGAICGRFKLEQVASATSVLPFWKKWLSAAMVLIGLNVLTEKAFAQKTTIEHKQVQPAGTAVNEVFGGVSEIMPEFPGGNKMLYAFINNHLDRSKAPIPCRINVTFIVEKDGSLTNIEAVGRVPDEGAKNEAIRVMNLSPKWKPAQQNQTIVKMQYTVPVVFK